jgi:methionyl-tRNA synthetase
VPFGNDGDYSRDAMVNRLNSDLANDLGNLCQRVLSMTGRNCDGAVPEPGAFTAEDEALLDAAGGVIDRLREAFDSQQFHAALGAIWDVVGDANRYVDAQAPWALRKTDPARMATVLYVVAETVRRLALLAWPVMPDSMARLLDQLGVPAEARDFAALEVPLTPGTPLPRPSGVFPRYAGPEEEG